MFYSVDHFLARQSGHLTRDHYNLMTAFSEFRRKTEPHFFNAASHDWRNGEECAQNNRYSHRAVTGSFRSCKSESTARFISNLCSKHLRAFCRIVSRSAGEVSFHRLSKRFVPSKLSAST